MFLSSMSPEPVRRRVSSMISDARIDPEPVVARAADSFQRLIACVCFRMHSRVDWHYDFIRYRNVPYEVLVGKMPYAKCVSVLLDGRLRFDGVNTVFHILVR